MSHWLAFSSSGQPPPSLTSVLLQVELSCYHSLLHLKSIVVWSIALLQHCFYLPKGGRQKVTRRLKISKDANIFYIQSSKVHRLLHVAL